MSTQVEVLVLCSCLLRGILCEAPRFDAGNSIKMLVPSTYLDYLLSMRELFTLKECAGSARKLLHSKL